MLTLCLSLLFFFHDTATTEIYTLSLHDALPILERLEQYHRDHVPPADPDAFDSSLFNERSLFRSAGNRDRKSTRLNSSHVEISYAVFCLKKKKKKIRQKCPKRQCLPATSNKNAT